MSVSFDKKELEKKLAAQRQELNQKGDEEIVCASQQENRTHPILKLACKSRQTAGIDAISKNGSRCCIGIISPFEQKKNTSV